MERVSTAADKNPSKNGLFTVKSAYHLLCNRKDIGTRATASSSSDITPSQVLDEVWKKIWSCSSTPRIHNFLWRSCANGVATGEALARRKAQIDPSCFRCGHPSESINHILLDCPFARATWCGSPLSYIPPQAPQLTQLILQWNRFRTTTKKEGRESVGLIGFICWSLWRSKNEAIFKGRIRSPEEVIREANLQASDFQLLFFPSLRRCDLPQAPPIYWSPAPNPTMKLNTDASLNNERGGLGLVLRNYQGRPTKACSIPATFTSSLEGEALALRVGLLHSIAECVDDLVAEMDCKELVNFFSNNPTPPPIPLFNVIADIKHPISSFRSCTVLFIPREINSMADSLARKATSLTCETTMPLSTPWLSSLRNQDTLCWARYTK
ncbi:uncharacterized protein LOC122655154 [Telopea speciosissima]|uniref:uncharacterized protein LOC122655154 n=1 Tax=Telopea speciosissima TaxID=54955 RepID=UPI001CC58ECB|nr:uncharacterized protein LOC122655154 [Telopea speciosissima]